MARWNDQESAGSGMFLLGALAGALVGAGVALLMAPKSGAETRQELNSGLNSMRDAASRRYRDLAEKATSMAEKARTAASERYNGGTAASVNDSFPTTPGTGSYQA